MVSRLFVLFLHSRDVGLVNFANAPNKTYRLGCSQIQFQTTHVKMRKQQFHSRVVMSCQVQDVCYHLNVELQQKFGKGRIVCLNTAGNACASMTTYLCIFCWF